LVDAGFDPHATAMALDDALDQREPDAMPFELLRMM